MTRVLVTGCGGSAGHNFIRSLRLANEEFYIVGTDMNRYHIRLSRANVNYLVPDYTEATYLPSLINIIKKEKIDFLHSQPDTEVAIISENREKIPCKTLLPSKKSIQIAHNKLLFSQLLREFEVPSPRSFLISNPNDIKNATKHLNDSIFWVRATKGAGSRAALPVRTFEQAKFWIEYWNDMKDIKWGEFMICEYLPGKEYAFQSIWKDGELITSQARQRIEYLFANRMPSGQSSTPTIAKTVHNDKVNEISVAGIRVLDKIPNGVYCVDLKENSQGIPCITEINVGRFFTTSIFFAVAGVNMPWIYVKSALGETLPLVKKFNPLPKDLYWIRQMDMTEVLIDEKMLVP